MPDTEQCPLGAANKANIDNQEKALDEFKIEVRTDIKYINQCVEKITNHYSSRPSWLICGLITGMFGTIIFLGQYIITNL